MKIVTWNLRTAWKNRDGINDFIHRAGFIYEKIMNEKPEIIAFQEVVPESLEFLKRVLPEYDFSGSMRTENYDEEGVYIAYLKEEFILLSSDSFWLSPTPYVTASRFEEQSKHPRVCLYNRLVYKKTKEMFSLFDLHLDHISNSAKLNGLNCVFDYIDKRQESIEKDRTIILGDFNALPDSEVIKLADSKDWIFDATKGIKGTFHKFGQIESKKIDYIYLSNALQKKVETVEIWQDEINGIYLSDHYPVCLTLKLI